MKNIIIISYFFAPCNLTASQRALGWVKYLKEFGYYPVVITRNWDVKIKKQSDISAPSGKKVIHKIEDGYEVYYLPYKGNLKDRIYSRFGDKFSVLRRFLSLTELVGQHFSNYFIPYSNIYNFAKDLIKGEKFKMLLITANPFIQFKFGYDLNRKFKIPWIADYRDDWSTDELSEKKGGLNRILHKLDCKSEKKWVESASLITSVSPYYIKKISDFTGVDGETIYNGFFEEEYTANAETLFDDITLTYNGTLYPSQNVEVFIEGFKKSIEKLKFPFTKVKLYFPGLEYKPDQAERIRKLLKGYEDHYIITNRISRDEVIKIQRKSHVLLMFPHNNIKGIPSSKLYEYLGLQKPILISPSDNDILEQTVKETNSGIVCQTADDVCDFICQLVNNYDPIISRYSFTNSLVYSRRNQTKRLAQLLDKII